MRKEFIECETIEQATDTAPWAAEIIEVDGGFMAFESATEAQVWSDQQ